MGWELPLTGTPAAPPIAARVPLPRAQDSIIVVLPFLSDSADGSSITERMQQRRSSLLIERHYKRVQPKKKAAKPDRPASTAWADEEPPSPAQAYRESSCRRGGLTETKRTRDSMAMVHRKESCRKRGGTPIGSASPASAGSGAEAFATDGPAGERDDSGTEASDTLSELPSARDSTGGSGTPLKRLMEDREARRMAAEQRSANRDVADALVEDTTSSEVNVISSASNARGGARRRSAALPDGVPAPGPGGGGGEERSSSRRLSTSFFIPDLSSVLIDNTEQEVVHLLSFRMVRHATGMLMHLAAALPTELIGGHLGQALKWILPLKVRARTRSRERSALQATSGPRRGAGRGIVAPAPPAPAPRDRPADRRACRDRRWSSSAGCTTSRRRWWSTTTCTRRT